MINTESMKMELLKYFPGLLFVTDTNGTFLSFGGDESKLYVSPDKFLGKTYHEILPACACDIFTKTIKIAKSEGIGQGEYPLAINEELHWYEVVTKRGEHEGEVIFVHIVVEVTSRKLLELKLAATAQIYRIQFESSVTAICWCDAIFDKDNLPIDFAISSVNESFYKLFDGVVIGTKISDKFLKFDFLVHCRHVMESREADSFEYHFQPEGLYCYINIYPISDTQLNISFVDITSNKKAEKLLLEAERLSAVGELAFGVAHDFNNSLQIILGNLDLALYNSSLDSDTRDLLTVVQSTAHDAASRVRQLQRLGSFSKQGEWSNIHIKKILDEIVLQARPLWKDGVEYTGHSITIEQTYGDYIINGLVGEIRSALFNILKNGIEAMPSGGTLTISANISDDVVCIKFVDTGVGMTPEVQKKMFQPFFSTKGFEKGRGLGMAAVGAIIRNHGGSVSVESEIDAGTTIIVSLPLVAEPDKEVIVCDKMHSEGAHILWVDDEDALRKMGTRMVEMLGHSGDMAASGAEALSLLQINKYDIMITDIGMSGMNGWQLIKNLNGDYPDMKVVVLSGWGDNLDKKEGVDFILGKPVSRQDLEQTIKKCLVGKNV